MPGSVEVSLSLKCHLQNNNNRRKNGSIRHGGTNPLDKPLHTAFPPHHIYMSWTLPLEPRSEEKNLHSKGI